jgi:hypothetical protein
VAVVSAAFYLQLVVQGAADIRQRVIRWKNATTAVRMATNASKSSSGRHTVSPALVVPLKAATAEDCSTHTNDLTTTRSPNVRVRRGADSSSDGASRSSEVSDTRQRAIDGTNIGASGDTRTDRAEGVVNPLLTSSRQ